jgi:hypothetical protein
MSQELTFYALFLLLTVSMGVVFQFMLSKIKALDNNQKAIVKSLGFVHGEVLKVKNNKIIDSPKVTKNSTWRGADTLKGDLTLEYRGAIADTRATFMLDKD